LIKKIAKTNTRSLFVFFVLFVYCPAVFSQALSGTYTISGTSSPYPTISAAISALNSNGVSGPVTFNVAASYTETFTSATAGLITSTGTSANPIVFQKSGAGANPLITAGPGIGNMDGIIVLSGTDYITFNGISVQENPANTDTLTCMEFGYALLKKSGTDGCQNVIIENCNIRLTTVYSLNYYYNYTPNIASPGNSTFPIGINCDNHTASSYTQLNVTTAGGENSNNQFRNNTISNVWGGIVLSGDSSAAYFDQNNEIAGSVISNQGTSTQVIDLVSTAVNIYINNQNSVTIANNTINATSINADADDWADGGEVYGIETAAGKGVNIYNDTIIFTVAGPGYTSSNYFGMLIGGMTGNVNIYNNVIKDLNWTAPVYFIGEFIAINSISACNSLSIYNNTITNMVTPALVTQYMIWNAGNVVNSIKIYGNTISDNSFLYGGYLIESTVNSTPGTYEINNNDLFNNNGGDVIIGGDVLQCIAVSGTAGDSCYSNTMHDNTSGLGFYGYVSAVGSPEYVFNNNIYNATGNKNVYGIRSTGSNTGNFYGNAIYNLTTLTTATTYGIATTGTSIHNIYQNSIDSLSSSGGAVNGVFVSGGTTVNVYKNWIYNLSSSTATGTVYGMNVTGGSTVNLYNNMIAGLTTPQATTSPAVNGLYLNGGAGTTNNAWYNSVYLTATGASGYGSAGIYTSTTPTITLTNNLVVNNSTPNGGIVAAHWRSSNSFATLTSSTDYNDYVADVAGGLIYHDPVNSASTISTYTTYVTSEKNSISVDPGFTPIATVDLHETDMSNPNPLVSAGTPVAGITDDFDGQIRQCPEIGCDEFAPCSLNISPNTTICQGTSTILTVSGSAGYTWYPSASLSSSTDTSVTANPTVTTTYTVTETYGVTISTTVFVDNPVLLTTPNTTICLGSSQNLSVVGSTNYTWSPAVVLITTNGSSVTASPIASTTYTIIGTATNGCISLGATSVGIYALPTLNTSPNLSICGGTSTGLSAGGALNYTWSPSLGLTASTGSLVTASPTVTTTYTVTGTDGNGCTSANQINIHINPLPTVNAGPDQNICPLTSTTLTAIGAISYTWSPAQFLNATLGTVVECSPTVLGAYTYTVTGTDINGCTSNGQVTVTQVSSITASAGNDVTVCVPNCTLLNASGGNSYTWYPSTGLSATDIYNPTACPNQTTTYTVVATGGIGCTANSSVTIYIASLPTITVSPGVTLCGGTAASLSASGAATYTWSPFTGLNTNTLANILADPNTSTLYAVIGTDSNGCSSTPATVNVTVLPVFGISPLVAVICDGSSSTLTANTVPGTANPVNFTWEPAGSLSQDTGTVVVAFPTLSTSYTVTAVDVNSCISQVSFTVTVNPLPAITLSAPATTICSGTSVNVTASGAATYTWSPATNPTTGASVKVQPAITTTYTVTGTLTYTQPDTNTCSSSAEITVKVNPLPVIAVSPDQTIIIGNTTTLSVITDATNYQWVPDNTTLTCNNCSNPVANPAKTTTYYITVTDSNGCYAKDSILITVNIICGNIFIPDAFSPNADDVNDVLRVYGTENCIDPNSYTFRVFDRWGNQVFESTDPNSGWDGKYKGKELNAEVFVYSLQATMIDGISISKKGNISLIK